MMVLYHLIKLLPTNVRKTDLLRVHLYVQFKLPPLIGRFVSVLSQTLPSPRVLTI